MSSVLSTQTVFWIVILVGIVSVSSTVWLFFISKKINQLLGGTDAKSIQEGMVLIRKELEALKQFKAETNQYLETVEKRLKRSVQSVETVRFNPFKGTGDGGNQSFSTAFIDEGGHGVVVSGLYSRERISVFSKAVKNFGSDFELTDEEQEVIGNSKNRLAKL